MKIAVIDSGIVGLTADYRLAVKGQEVAVFEKNASPGGKIGGIDFVGGSVRQNSGIPLCLANTVIVANEIPAY